jgi:hypothetical protein
MNTMPIFPMPMANTCRRLLLLALLIVALFFAVQDRDQYHWSDWWFGDAQTMLSLREWQEGGWANNYFLFKPQGYAKVVDLLDLPELRHHAHGISPGSSPRVGPRLLYTHYPAGYLVPYALLFKLGVDSMFAMRLLSVTISLGALGVMYALFARLTSPPVALGAVLFYVLSPMFLGYADSLANQPLDDLLRYAFMLAVVLGVRSDQVRWRRGMMISAWLLEFVLSLSSFDSVLFVYLWLVGFDLLERRGLRWKTYLLFALAPLLAESLLILQNAWYLGWSDAMVDMLDTFVQKSVADHGGTVIGALGAKLTAIVLALLSVFYSVYSPGVVLLAIACGYGVGLRRHRGEGAGGLPTLGLLLLLLVCGLAFAVVLPVAAGMSYEGRQMLPCIALLVGGCTWMVVEDWRTWLRAGTGAADGGVPLERPLLLVSTLLLCLFWGWYLVNNHHTSIGRGEAKDIRLAQDLKTLATAYEPVFFNAGGFGGYYNPVYVVGYPQIQPDTEYYIGSRPILCFDQPEALVQDMVFMIGQATSRFSPVAVTDTQEKMERIVVLLKRQGVLLTTPAGCSTRNEKLVLDFTQYVKWPPGR